MVHGECLGVAKDSGDLSPDLQGELGKAQRYHCQNQNRNPPNRSLDKKSVSEAGDKDGTCTGKAEPPECPVVWRRGLIDKNHEASSKRNSCKHEIACPGNGRSKWSWHLVRSRKVCPTLALELQGPGGHSQAGIIALSSEKGNSQRVRPLSDPSASWTAHRFQAVQGDACSPHRTRRTARGNTQLAGCQSLAPDRTEAVLQFCVRIS
jgi:hypothetical protein